MTKMISGARVKVAGNDLSSQLMQKLDEIRVEDNLNVPSSFSIRIKDPGLASVDSNPLVPGAEVEVNLEAPDGNTDVTVFKGEITALEPEFSQNHGVTLVARGLDKSHRLFRRKKTKTFQDQTFADAARAVIGDAQLSPGEMVSDSVVQKYILQHDETDWEFLNRLARRIDAEVVAEDGRVHFRKAGGPSGAQTVELAWGQDLLTFKPRVTAIEQPQEVEVRGWDAITKQPLTGTKSGSSPDSKIGIDRGSVVSAIPGSPKVLVADQPVTTSGEASKLAESVMARLANSYVEAEAKAKGNPNIKAGSKVKVSGVGQKFSGTYTVSAATHVYKGTHGYHTYFKVSGRAARTLIDLMTRSGKRSWTDGVVVGTVSNNQDPEHLGRVRVKFPELGGDVEGWWAKVVTPSAGNERGMLMMPVNGEEVLVAFEHGDARRPYVIGSLFNQNDKPGKLLKTVDGTDNTTDGSFALRSDKEMRVESQGKTHVKSGADAKYESSAKTEHKSSGDWSLKSDASVKQEAATNFSIKAGSQVTIKGSSQVEVASDGTLTIKGTNVTVQASGPLSLKGNPINIG